MSRIGLKPIEIPEGVEIKINDNHVIVKGPKGELSKEIHENIEVVLEDNQVVLKRENDLKENRSLHGTSRSLISNKIGRASCRERVKHSEADAREEGETEKQIGRTNEKW